MDLGTAHLTVVARAARLTGRADLERASRALRDVFDWPSTVVGDELDAPYAAPTSGGPPFRAYELVPVRAFLFPTADQFEQRSSRSPEPDPSRSGRDPQVQSSECSWGSSQPGSGAEPSARAEGPGVGGRDLPPCAVSTP